MQIDYIVGHGHHIQGELLQANCIDPITGISFSSQQGSYAKNLTHDYHNFYYSFNDASNLTSEDNAIFSASTWEINVCHVTSLVGSSPIIKNNQVLKFDVELEHSGESISLTAQVPNFQSNHILNLSSRCCRWILWGPSYCDFRSTEV